MFRAILFGYLSLYTVSLTASPLESRQANGLVAGNLTAILGNLQEALNQCILSVGGGGLQVINLLIGTLLGQLVTVFQGLGSLINCVLPTNTANITNLIGTLINCPLNSTVTSTSTLVGSVVSQLVNITNVLDATGQCTITNIFEAVSGTGELIFNLVASLVNLLG
ncbi:hypothetical protein FQA39_LY10166 [Lamprigera yunnana]|nr:hypothetical protein FQA39_LY10166 [Lamprigera yunnana]